MIISQTPLRISFVGGGSDLPSFFKNSSYGAVVSMTINKFVYVMVNRKFDDDLRISYSVTENVSCLDEVKHDIIRNSLLSYGVKKAIEVVTIADVPGKGSGLGSSSALAVGLANALSAFEYKTDLPPTSTANIATMVERNMCGKPIGYQDQYACAHGGMNYIRFSRNGNVDVRNIWPGLKTMIELDSRLMLFHIPREGNGDDILVSQNNALSTNVETMIITEKMVQIADRMFEALTAKDLSSFGKMLDENWQLKRSISNSITNSKIDKVYAKAMDAGAEGGKLCGAGGGGFLLFYVPFEKQEAVRKAVALPEMPFTFCNHGSKVIHVG